MSIQKYDEVISLIANYVEKPPTFSKEAYETAAICFGDALGCAILALNFPQCTKLLGPLIEGTIVPNGSRIPATSFILDPVRAALNLGILIRWLDFNDTWLAAEWGHPSDNLGGILAVADHLSQTSQPEMTMKELFELMIQAHEIQGILALGNSFNRQGIDHVILVKIATAAVCTKLLGGKLAQIEAVLSNSFIDLGPLRTYRHAPNTGSRKSWAAGDATSRGLQLAYYVMQGEMGYPTALTAKKWGLYDVLFKGLPLKVERPLGCYVMENVLFKVSFPAEFHAQTAVEAAISLHSLVKGKLEEIERIDIETHESAIRIIDKQGPLKNPADRDHCLQYMVAIALIFGNLTADHYEDDVAADVRIDPLRSKMKVREETQFSLDYLDPDKRSIANSIQIFFKDGTATPKVTVEYPLGHRFRRDEALPKLREKCFQNLRTRFLEERSAQLVDLFFDYEKVAVMKVKQVMDLL